MLFWPAGKLHTRSEREWNQFLCKSLIRAKRSLLCRMYAIVDCCPVQILSDNWKTPFVAAASEDRCSKSWLSVLLLFFFNTAFKVKKYFFLLGLSIHSCHVCTLSAQCWSRSGRGECPNWGYPALLACSESCCHLPDPPPSPALCSSSMEPCQALQSQQLFVALVTVSLHQGSVGPPGRGHQRGFSVTTHVSLRCSITIQKP